MSTVSSTRRAPRRLSQDGSADKVVVNLEASSPVVGSSPSFPVAGSRQGVSATVAGAQNSPIDVEAIEDEVQAISPSRVPPPRNRRTRRQPVTVVDLEVEGSQQVIYSVMGVSYDDASVSSDLPTGNKRQRVVHCLSQNRGEGSSFQANKEVPKEPTFTCPICWNKMEEPATTPCGHIFCNTCIKQAIKVQKRCPTCRKGLRATSVHRIYLPSTAS
nr:E3 ubiquitin-protein ligase RNF4-like isoform X2 [Setaria viridis]